MQIHKDSTAEILPHFQEKEFFSKSPYASNPHYLDDDVIKGIGIIREYFNSPMMITSTFRTPLHNSLIGGGSRSQHLVGRAIDFSFEDPTAHDRYYTEISSEGPLFKKLREARISGFGLYDNFNHIDSRETGSEKDVYGSCSYWDNSSKKKSMLASLGSTLANTEDGYLDWIRIIRASVLLLIAILIIVVIVLTVNHFRHA